MEEELNYPIKYAVLELKINGGWDTHYEDITFGFIVSKCYIVNQNIRYQSDGTSELTYDVVFPYKDIQTFNYRRLKGKEFNEEESIPKYSSYGRCTNSDTVSEVFDTYEEATELATKMNDSYQKTDNVWLYTPGNNIQDRYIKGVKKFQQNLLVCKQYELIIQEKTTNMTITKEDISIKRLTLK